MAEAAGWADGPVLATQVAVVGAAEVMLTAATWVARVVNAKVVVLAAAELERAEVQVVVSTTLRTVKVL